MCQFEQVEHYLRNSTNPKTSDLNWEASAQALQWLLVGQALIAPAGADNRNAAKAKQNSRKCC